MGRSLLAVVLLGASPALAWGQTTPPAGVPAPPIVEAPAPDAPPVYPPPPVYSPPAPAVPLVPPPASIPPPPQMPIDLRPAAEPPRRSELGLAAGELGASMAVSAAATAAVYAVIGGDASGSGAQAAAELVVLLYVALVPTLSALPVWLIGSSSSQYDVRFSAAVEAGSVVSGIALIVYFVATSVRSDSTGSASVSGLALAAGGLMVVGMPLAEVISLNLKKVPHPAAAPRLAASAARADVHARVALRGAAEPHTVIVGLPAIAF